MKLLVLLASFLWILTFTSNAQYWVQKAGGITIDEAADIALDNNGNSYTVGYFTGTANFGTTSLNAQGSTDIFLTKTNNQGVIQWAVSAGGTGSDKGSAIAVDNAGNSYITGFFNGTALFDTVSITAIGLQDAFAAKYDANGNLQWLKTIGGTNADIGNGIAVDYLGNAIVTGEFSGTANFGSIALTSLAGSTDAFVTKFSSSGGFLWAKKGSGAGTDRGIDVAIDANGNIYATGLFSNNFQFDVLQTNFLSNVNYLIKFNASGAEQWFRKIGGGSSNVVNALASDSIGNLYVTGDFTGTMQFYDTVNLSLSATYTNRVFVAKYTNSGGAVWAASTSSESSLTAQSIAADNLGNVYITGHFECQLGEYRDAYGSGIFQTIGLNDIYVCKFDSIGSWQYAKHFAGLKDDYGYGIDVKQNDRPHFCGSFKKYLNIPYSGNFIAANVGSLTTFDCGGNNGFCGDANYGKFKRLMASNDNSDILIANTVDPNRSPYDFFDRSGALGCDRPFIELCQMPGCPDTFATCSGFGSEIQFFQCQDVGPQYATAWSGPVDPDPLIPHYGLVSGSGQVRSNTSSPDACIVTLDTLLSIIHPQPLKPGITDDHGVNNNHQYPTSLDICAPDTVTLTAGNLLNNTFIWNSPSLPAPVNDTTISVDTSGIYSVLVVDSNGCQNATSIQLNFYDSLPPFLLTCTQDDTLSFCDNVQAGFWMYDSIDNPSGQEICFTNLPYPVWTTVTNISPSNLVYSDICGSTILLYPTTSQYVSVDVMVVRVSPCGNDTHYLTKSFYLEIMPAPVITPFGLQVSGPTTFCPNDSFQLVATNSPGHIWMGPGVVNQTTDTVTAYQEGEYSALIQLSDTNAFGCITLYAEQASILVNEKQSPQITSSSTLLCPNSSVMIEVGVGATQFYNDPVYFWEGPNGPIGNNGPYILANAPGQYFCMVMDGDSCGLVSNSITITQYTEPRLEPIGDNVMCENDSVIIEILTNPGSIINWLPPLSGNTLSQTVYSPGVYRCNIFSCGIFTTDSIEIVASNVKAEITIDGPLCDSQTVMLLANDSMATYHWFPTNENTQNIEVADNGSFVLTTIDSAGCFAVSDTTVVINHQIPTVISYEGDSVICFGESIELVGNDSMNSYLWQPYGQTSQRIVANEAGFYSLSSIDTNGCAGGSVPILISMPDTFINTESVGNLRFCEGDSVLLQAKKNGYDAYLWKPGNFYGKDYTVFETGIYQLIATDTFGCEAFSAKYTIYAEPNLIGTPLGFDTTICIGTVANLSATTNLGEIEWLDSITNDRVAVGTDFVTNPIFENTTFLVWSNHELCKSDSAYVTVFVQDCNTPQVPNIFTPNADGTNDIFRMSLIENQCFHGYIYNRWGALIFETQNINTGWDGSIQNTGEAASEGTYFFVFEYCKHDGTEGTSQGTVTLIRE